MGPASRTRCHGLWQPILIEMSGQCSTARPQCSRFVSRSWSRLRTRARPTGSNPGPVIVAERGLQGCRPAQQTPVRLSPAVPGQRRGEQVVGGAVEVVATAVVAPGGAGVGVAEGVLYVLERGAQAQRFGGVGVPQAVWTHTSG